MVRAHRQPRDGHDMKRMRGYAGTRDGRARTMAPASVRIVPEGNR
jgi:hypothetical protein